MEFVCQYCGKQFDTQKCSFTRHEKTCSQNPNKIHYTYSNAISTESGKCQYCGKSCKNQNSLRNHERLCYSNSDRQIIDRSGENNPMFGKSAWNKGLTKDSDDRVAKYTEGVKLFYTTEQGLQLIQWYKNEFTNNDTFKESGRSGGIRSIQVQQKRSKNEIAFCELCEQHFQMVLHNKPIFNGWDADVIIEDCNVAIMWNGRWHYESICKSRSLDKVLNRDNSKIDQILECGYIPYVIKDMGGYDKDKVEREFTTFINWLEWYKDEENMCEHY